MSTPQLCPKCGAILEGKPCAHCGNTKVLQDYGFEIRRARQGLNLYVNGSVKTNFKPHDKKDQEKLKDLLLGVPSELLDQAVATALEYEEKIIEQKPETQPAIKAKEIDPETRNKSLTLLQDPAFFFKLGGVMEWGFKIPKINKVRFVTGEERNKRLVPLQIGAAAKLNLTSILRLLGLPGTGKDAILRLSLALSENGVSWVERGYLTGAGMRYSQKIKNAEVLYPPDSPEFSGEMGRQLRLMRSDDGGLIYEYALKDKETGEMTTKEETLPIKVIVTSSNELRVDPALESGSWTIEADEDPELTRIVQQEKLKLRAGKRPTFPVEELRVWKAVFQIALTEEIPNDILIPYADSLIFMFSKEATTQRRSPDKLCDLIVTIAFWRRFQKPKDLREQADLADLYIALQLGLNALLKTVSPLDELEKKVINYLKGHPNSTTRIITEETRKAYNTNYQVLERLVDKGWLSKDKEGNRNVYSTIFKGENEDNVFNTLEKSDDSVFKLLDRFSSSVGNSSNSHEIMETELIDPLSGQWVKVTLIDGRCEHIEEKRSYDLHYSIPNKSSKSSVLTEETGTLGEKELNNLTLRENKTGYSPDLTKYTGGAGL